MQTYTVALPLVLTLALLSPQTSTALNVRTAPDVSAEVVRESQENIQIHDGFVAQEQKDIKKEKEVHANKDLSAMQVKTAPDVSAEVARESQENIQIHDGFASQEQQDIKKEKEVHSNKDLSAMHVGSWVVALDHDLKTHMLIQTQAKNTSLLELKGCGDLVCPGTFTVTEEGGNCYCVNPDIVVEKEIGATGSSGGALSTFCPKVWCFPTMCSKPEVAPTTTNGMCCPTCPA
mmetsp:Transcript_166626/g.295099  ORF Transcript_166626/g.295099 Transcript_166626/m.295099 type:complete len:233 (+) Transcript_166626:65-763(+)